MTQELGERKYNFLWCPISQICFPVNLSLFPPLSIWGLGAFSPAEMPYPLQAPVCGNSQLRHRWTEGPPGLVAGALSRSLSLSLQLGHAASLHYHQHICKPDCWRGVSLSLHCRTLRNLSALTQLVLQQTKSWFCVFTSILIEAFIF